MYNRNIRKLGSDILNQANYEEILALAAQETAQVKTISYLSEHLRRFVEPGERVLICFPTHEKGNLSWLMEQAVLHCGARPVVWGEDHRWKTLLRLAFTSRASTIIGMPLVLLGLSKLKKANATPLFIKNAVVAGYPCAQWLLDGICNGFDCRIWGCFSLDTSGVVLAFSCDQRGIHLREDAYTLTVKDEEGNLLPDGEIGEWTLCPKDRPELTYTPQEYAMLESEPCPCGEKCHRLRPIHYTRMEDPELAELGKYLHSWTSVLDCNLRRGPYGLELELVIFPGEKLPKLPTCARQVVRPWQPERDEPFMDMPLRKNNGDFPESH